MEQAACERAARQVAQGRLLRRRLHRLDGVITIDDGYAVQAAANRLLASALGPVAGFKIGGTTERMRAFIRADRPIAGAVFASTVYRSGVRLRFSDFIQPGIETEIAVRLKADLGPEGAPMVAWSV
jgi:2-keto-4-pentenoate hydratase